MENNSITEFKDTATLLNQTQIRLKSLIREAEAIVEVVTAVQLQEQARVQKEQEASKALFTSLAGIIEKGIEDNQKALNEKFGGNVNITTDKIIDFVNSEYGFADIKFTFKAMTDEERKEYERAKAESPKNRMNLEDFYDQADLVHAEVQNSLPQGYKEYEEFRTQYLGRKGKIADLFDNLRFMPLAQRRDYVEWLNRIKTQAQEVYRGVNHE